MVRDISEETKAIAAGKVRMCMQYGVADLDEAGRCFRCGVARGEPCGVAERQMQQAKARRAEL